MRKSLLIQTLILTLIIIIIFFSYKFFFHEEEENQVSLLSKTDKINIEKKEDLLNKLINFLNSNFSNPNKCYEMHLIEWVNYFMNFKSKTVQKCSTKNLR